MITKKNSLQQKSVQKSKPSFIVFSIEYLILTTAIYVTLVTAPVEAFHGHWWTFIAHIAIILIGFRLTYAVIARYFLAANRDKSYIEFMTVLTLIPPILGPIIVLANGLTVATSEV